MGHVQYHKPAPRPCSHISAPTHKVQTLASAWVQVLSLPGMHIPREYKSMLLTRHAHATGLHLTLQTAAALHHEAAADSKLRLLAKLNAHAQHTALACTHACTARTPRCFWQHPSGQDAPPGVVRQDMKSSTEGNLGQSAWRPVPAQ